jgi:hypothetical protein
MSFGVKKGKSNLTESKFVFKWIGMDIKNWNFPADFKHAKLPY